MNAEKSFAPAHGEAAGGTPSADERVSILVGDRLCVTCGFNLAGQSVVREPHYRMLIARCPECATVASLQEFPILGKWAMRWGGVLAAAWFVVMLLLTLGSAGAIFGMSYGVARMDAKPLADFMSKEHGAWAKSTRDEQNTAQLEKAQSALAIAKSEASAAQIAAEASPDSAELRATADAAALALTQAEQRIAAIQATIDQQVQWQAYYDATWVSKDWLAQQDLGALAARARAEGASHSADAVKFWLLLAMIAFTLGVIWGVALLHARARRMALVCMVILALVAAMAAIQRTGGGLSTTFVGAVQMELTTDVAARLNGLTPFALSAGLAMIPLFLGMISGRPLARLYIRLMLPPRLRGSLATLWITDGLSPPSAR
jgi:hypothetical protein